MKKVITLMLILGITGCSKPQYILGYQVPIKLVDHDAKNKHELPLSTVRQWVIEGLYSGFAITHQGPSEFYFKNGMTISIYHNTPKHIVRKFEEILKLNPASNPVNGVVE